MFGLLHEDGPAPLRQRGDRTGAGRVRCARIDVAGHTGAPVPLELDRPARSSRPASLAAKAAERQGDEVAERVLRRLREAWFVDGRPADSDRRVAAALAHLSGLDLARLVAPDPAVERVRRSGPHPGALRRDGDGVRYAFPTLVLAGPGGTRIVPCWRSAASYDDAALGTYRSLTITDLELLTGSQLPPLDAVPVETATTPLFVHPDDVPHVV